MEKKVSRVQGEDETVMTVGDCAVSPRGKEEGKNRAMPGEKERDLGSGLLRMPVGEGG